MSRRRFWGAVAVSAGIVLSASAWAQVPQQLGYEGRLLEADGTPAQGRHTFAFVLWSTSSGGTAPLWSDTFKIAVVDGLYSVQLGGDTDADGGVNPLPSAIFDGTVLYLEITVDGETLSPRQPMGSVPYALRAGSAQSANTATNVSGGSVDATNVKINGTSIIDNTGHLTGAAASDFIQHAQVTAPLVGDGTASSPLGIPQCTSLANGYLSSADWNTFNGKVDQTDPRLADARNPLPGSASYIQNQTAAPQQGASFNIANDAYVGGNVGVGTTTPDAKLTIYNQTARQVETNGWADLSSNAGGHGLFASNAYTACDSITCDRYLFSNSHTSIGATGFGANYPFWNTASIFVNPGPSTANALFTPNVVAEFDTTGMTVPGNINAGQVTAGNWHFNATNWPGQGGFIYNGGDVTLGVGSSAGQASIQIDGAFRQQEAGKANYFLDKVGIGTTAPSLPLQISDSNNILVGLSGMNAQGTFLHLENSTATSAWNLAVSGNSGWAGGANKLIIDEHGQGPRFTIAPGGNVGIDTTSPTNALQVGGDARVGLITSALTSTPGWGNALVLSGGPDIFSGWDSDNSDPLWLARYNAAANSTELRVVVGDDPGQSADKFVIGAMQGYGYFTTAATWVPKFSVSMDGNVRATGSFIANTTPDLAETIPADGAVEAADVVCADPRHRERVVRCGEHGAHVPLGVISDGTSSFLINAHGGTVDAPLTGKPLVLAGRVPVKVTLENGPIQIGDALSPSSRPGVAMRARGNSPTIGIALESLSGSKPRMGSVLAFIRVEDRSGVERHLNENISLLEQQNTSLKAQNSALQDRLARLERTVDALVARSNKLGPPHALAQR